MYIKVLNISKTEEGPYADIFMGRGQDPNTGLTLVHYETIYIFIRVHANSISAESLKSPMPTGIFARLLLLLK